jgi:hypothetical protein
MGFGKLTIYVLKGTGTLLHVLHVCYSFHQKCSKLHTFIDQGPNILETGTKFKILVLNCPFRVPQNQVCGSGSGFRDFVDPDPDWESGSGSMGKKNEGKKHNFL